MCATNTELTAAAPLPTDAAIPPRSPRLPVFNWRTVFFFMANPLVLLPFATAAAFVLPGLSIRAWGGSAFALTMTSTKVGLLVAMPMLLLSLVADKLIPALSEVNDASRVITLYAIGTKLVPLRALVAATLVSTSAAVAEEIAFRGTLQVGLSALGSSTPLAPSLVSMLAVIGQALVFGKLHSYTESSVYAVMAAVAGLAFGAAFAVTNNLWVPIVAHFVVDLVGFVACHVQVARKPPDEQAKLLAMDLPIANALRASSR